MENKFSAPGAIAYLEALRCAIDQMNDEERRNQLFFHKPRKLLRLRFQLRHLLLGEVELPFGPGF